MPALRLFAEHPVEDPVVDRVDEWLPAGQAARTRQRVQRSGEMFLGDTVVLADDEVEPLVVALHDLLEIRSLDRSLGEAESGDIAHHVRPFGKHLLEPHAIEVSPDDRTGIDQDVLRAFGGWAA